MRKHIVPFCFAVLGIVMLSIFVTNSLDSKEVLAKDHRGGNGFAATINPGGGGGNVLFTKGGGGLIDSGAGGGNVLFTKGGGGLV